MFRGIYWILKIIAQVVRFNTIFLPQGSEFRLFFVSGEGGEFALSKKSEGFCQGGQALN